MTETTNFGLKKPEENDFYDFETQNENLDVIDEKLKECMEGGTAEKVTYENESVAGVTNVKEALDGIFDGTQQVKNSAKLGGIDASEYALGEDYLSLDSIPQMLQNVEYRTNEYFLGKPVFTMIVYVGWSAAGAHTFDLTPLNLNIEHPITVDVTNNDSEAYTGYVSNLVFRRTDVMFDLRDPAGGIRLILKYTKEGVTV